MFPGSSSFMVAPPDSLHKPRLTAVSGRWASEAFTSEYAVSPQPISANAIVRGASRSTHSHANTGLNAFMQQPGASAVATSNDEVESTLPQPHPHSLDLSFYPPPPPPIFSARSQVSMQKLRMMRWYQVIEKWCNEVGKSDKQRLIVAPPPRPPPFTDCDAIVAPVVDLITAQPSGYPARRGSKTDRDRSRQSVGNGQSVTPPSSAPSPVSRGAPYSYAQWADRCRVWWRHIVHHHEKLKELFLKQLEDAQRRSEATASYGGDDCMMARDTKMESFDITEGPPAAAAKAKEAMAIATTGSVPLPSNIPDDVNQLVMKLCVV